jgi:hypothetical protein
MHEIREPRLEQSCVTAVFEDRALSFILAKGATLEELSDRLADLGQRQDGRPVAITVKFDSWSRKGRDWVDSSSVLPAAMLNQPRLV